jgi:hypothetical protein
MPLPPAPSAPYDTSEYVLNLARARAGDAGVSLAGNLLADTQPYTLTYLNSAIRTVQDLLMNNGVETYPTETVLYAMPATATLDPALYSYIGYTNAWDGVNLWQAPLLPQDLVIPLRMYERLNGSMGQMVEMFPTNDGLPSRPKTAWNRQWEWRDNQINLVGATQVNDMRLRYDRFIPDITSLAVPQPIPISVRCADALAWFVAWEFASPRNSLRDIVNEFRANGEAAIKAIALRTTRKTQRNNNRRRPYDQRGGNGGYYSRY